jgi:hypothetical protein
MRLSLKDYISVLKYYKIDASNMKKGEIKKKAEGILAEKLCRCIKKVDKSLKGESKGNSKSKGNGNSKSKKNTESRAIAICKNSVLTKKKLFTPKFKCKGTAKLLPSNKREKLSKL